MSEEMLAAVRAAIKRMAEREGEDLDEWAERLARDLAAHGD